MSVCAQQVKSQQNHELKKKEKEYVKLQVDTILKTFKYCNGLAIC